MADYRISDLVASLRCGELSRREFLTRAAVIGLSVPAATAILESGASAQADATTLVVTDALSGSQWLTMDPGWFFEINSSMCMQLLNESLYHIPDSSKPTEIQPLLAEDFPVLSDDGMTATIKLRQGVTFHNTGNPLTAADVVFSWNRLKNIGFQGSFFAIDYWESVEAVDDATVQINLSFPNAALTPLLTVMPLAITDSKAVIEMGGTDAEPSAEEDSPEVLANKDASELISQTSVSTGPYMMSQWDVNSEVIIERNPNYWGEAPAFERIIFRNINDANAQLQAVQTAEADIAYSLNLDSTQTVLDDANLQMLEGPTLAIQYIGMNMREERGGAVSKLEVRQAFAYAIDYDGIIESLLQGAADRPAAFIPLGLGGADEFKASNLISQDLVKAQELWDASGVGEAEIEITYDSDNPGVGGVNLETLATKVKSDLEQIQGCTINLAPMPGAERLAAYRAQDFQATISPWTPDFPDPDNYATPFSRTETSAAGRVGFSDPEVDALLDQGISEMDPAARPAIYVQIQEKVMAQQPYIVFFQPIDKKPARAVVEGAMTHSVYQIQLRYASKTE